MFLDATTVRGMAQVWAKDLMMKPTIGLVIVHSV